MPHPVNNTDQQPPDAQKEKEAFAPGQVFSQLMTSFTGKTVVTSFTSFSGWAEGTKELLDQLPQVWTRGLLYTLMGCAGIVIPWSILYKIDETGTARGRIEPQGKTVKLDAVAAATVVEVKVKEGDKVTKNQDILVLESALARNELRQAQEKLESQIARLENTNLVKNQLAVTLATQRQQNQAQMAEKQTQIAQAQQNLQTLQNNYQAQNAEKQAQLNQAAQTLSDRQASMDLQSAEKRSQVSQAKQSIEDSQAAAAMAKIRLADAQSEMARYQKLYKTGAIPQVRLLEADGILKERKLAALQAQSALRQAELRYQEQNKNSGKLTQQGKSDISQANLRYQEQQENYRRSISQLQADIAQAQLRLKEQQDSYQTLNSSSKLAVLKVEEQIKSTEAQIATIQSEITQSRIQIDSLKQQLDQRTIKSPIDGIVFQLPIQKAGAMAQPGKMVAEIAPAGSKLVVRAQIATTESGSLRVGLPVKLKFDAYPFQDYGIGQGKVIEISPTTLTPEAGSNNNSAAYNLSVSLEKDCLQHGKQCIALRPGETVTAEVVIRQRRIIDFFLDPFRKLQQGGLKL